MAGGPTTPELVVAAAAAGGLGFLAGGYKSAEALAGQIAEVRRATATFGVNLFAPNPAPVDPTEYARYRDAVRADAERFGAAVAEEPVEDDDGWRDKIDLLLADPAPVVSFTFGIPDTAALAALRKAGSLLVQTVTSGAEAVRAAEAGIDLLAVQAAVAGGHSGTLTPERPPPAAPLRELLAEIKTVVTRAFTGRPARALPNTFLTKHTAHAPLGYPAVHHLTSPMRKAAAAAGNAEYVNLWAGTGHRAVAERAAAEILHSLAAEI
jgi:NAD(P)H-dependent flavin oxidoreductase YrpB (nitropropane dioxygenase family)